MFNCVVRPLKKAGTQVTPVTRALANAGPRKALTSPPAWAKAYHPAWAASCEVAPIMSYVARGLAPNFLNEAKAHTPYYISMQKQRTALSCTLYGVPKSGSCFFYFFIGRSIKIL